MANKNFFLFLTLLISININNIISFKYPINKDLLSSETGKQTSIEVSEKSDYDKYILNNNYVLAIFHADWCGHCKRFLPVINEASKYLQISKTWKLLKIPCTKYPNLCNSFSIEGYPTVKVYKNSQELKGISPPRDLENFLEFLIKISSEPIINITSQQEFYNNYGTFSPVIEYSNKLTESVEDPYDYEHAAAVQEAIQIVMDDTKYNIHQNIILGFCQIPKIKLFLILMTMK